jgi:hypothetical protein
MLYRITAILFTGILFAASCENQSAKDTDSEEDLTAINFVEDIAPIIYQHCSPCHRDGGAGPFPMVKWEDVEKRVRMIQLVTEDRLMPPWPADPDYRHFLGENVLSDEQIAMISTWVNEGGFYGNPDKRVFAPDFPENSNLGEPDLVLKFPPFQIPETGQDQFLQIKIPYEIPDDKYVRAIEFIPDKRKLVHHMNANLFTYRSDYKEDVFGGDRIVPTESVDGSEDLFNRMDALHDNGNLPFLTPNVCNYLPGVFNPAYPAGIGGFKLTQKGSFWINDMHYGPSSEKMVDESRFNIFFADAPPQRPTLDFIIGTLGKAGGPIEPPLVIPADSVMHFNVQYTLEDDISLLTINPHMHLLGKYFKAYAVDPAGDTIPLVHIPEWNFRWQYFYTFEKMLPLFKGTTIYVEASMDNTVNNPDNPFDPPREAREPYDVSMKTVDEMLQFIVTCVAYKPGDENISLKPDDLGIPFGPN